MYFPSFIPYDPKLSTYNWTNNFFLTRFLICKQEKRTLLYCLVETHARGYCHDTRITLTAQAKGIGALGTRIKIDHYGIFLKNSFMRSAFRRSVYREVFAWNFSLRQWLPICTQIFSSLRAVFPFRLLYSFLTYWFLYLVLPRLYQQGEKNNSSKTYLCIYFHYVI